MDDIEKVHNNILNENEGNINYLRFHSVYFYEPFQYRPLCNPVSSINLQKKILINSIKI